VELAGFDERIRRYGLEDIEFGYRLARAGARIRYLPEAVSRHRAYATNLERYLARHLEVGWVARQLVRCYPDGPFREYLRVDPPARLWSRSESAGLALLRLAHRFLLRRPVRLLLGSSPGFAAFRVLLRGLELLRFDRAAHFGYHVAADLRYFQGYFGEMEPANP
jgi:GT2 family glycosyltransferase